MLTQYLRRIQGQHVAAAKLAGGVQRLQSKHIHVKGVPTNSTIIRRQLKNLKETESEISSDPPSKDGKCTIHNGTLKHLNLIKNLEDTFVILLFFSFSFL